MAFFNTQPHDADDAPHSEQSGKAPLFRQDDTQESPSSGRHITLSDYVSQHLSENPPSAQKPAEPLSSQSSPAPAFNTPFQRVPYGASGRGRVLNTLDVDFTGGLEQYLPTPAFRLRVMKKRLDGEIADLRTRLNKYQRLSDPSAELQQRIQEIRERLTMLEEHERSVSTELASILRFGPFLYQLSKRLGSINDSLNLLEKWHKQWQKLLRRAIYGEKFLQVEAVTVRMRTLKELMAERLQDPAVSDNEISVLLNRYEQALQQMESVSEPVQNQPKDFRTHWWQRASRLVE